MVAPHIVIQKVKRKINNTIKRVRKTHGKCDIQIFTDKLLKKVDKILNKGFEFEGKLYYFYNPILNVYSIYDIEKEELFEREEFNEYNVECIGKEYGCDALTNGTQLCCKLYCPYIE